MDIKGTAVKSTELFVKEKFADGYEKWINILPEESRKIFEGGILSSSWYSLKDAVLIPTIKIGENFYEGDTEKAAYEVGRFSAVYALKGVYKIFVKIASADFVIKRTTSIFSTYYSNGDFKISHRDSDKVEFIVSGFKKGDEIIFPRITGWAEGVFNVISDQLFETKLEFYEIENDFLEGKINIFWK